MAHLSFAQNDCDSPTIIGSFEPCPICMVQLNQLNQLPQPTLHLHADLRHCCVSVSCISSLEPPRPGPPPLTMCDFGEPKNKNQIIKHGDSVTSMHCHATMCTSGPIDGLAGARGRERAAEPIDKTVKPIDKTVKPIGKFPKIELLN
jgi:hypothetical protein